MVDLPLNPFSAINFITSVYKFAKNWWTFFRPAGKVLGSGIDNNKTLKVFLKDLDVPDNTLQNPKLISQEGEVLQYNPNIAKVWPEVEGRGLAEILNLLGRLGKKDKLEIVEMSRGYDQWNTNLIVLGAQAFKSREFYDLMESVGYYMDEKEIYDRQTNEVISRDPRYGYGLIIKAKNPNLTSDKKNAAILLGGFGTLGTEAAIYYFCNNIDKLGKQFGNKCFSVIVQARINSGRQTAKRIKSLDKIFN